MILPNIKQFSQKCNKWHNNALFWSNRIFLILRKRDKKIDESEKVRK